MGSIRKKIRVSLIIVPAIWQLTGCALAQPEGLDNTLIHSQSYINNYVGYSFVVPTGFADTKDDDEGMYFGYSSTSEYGHFYVQSYDALQSKACNSQLTGASKMELLNSDLANQIWGKVDFYDLYWTGDFPQGFEDLCRPMLDPGAAYVLCAERNGKTVLICVSQAKDDPDMAKQIFESFRWAE